MIASLRYQIELFTLSREPDEAGGARLVENAATAIWAAVERLPAAASSTAGEPVRLKRVKALIRARAGADIGARFRFDGVTYEVVSVETDDDRGRRVFLIGEEILA
jgi:head-tail adaptor